MNESSVATAINGSTYVVHTASPFQLSYNTEDDLIKPAVEGTLAVLSACKANKVKRVVITSSVAAVKSGYSAADRPDGNVFNETHWSKLDSGVSVHPYSKSKTLAERAVWDFQSKLEEADKFDIVVICPSFI